MISYNLTLFCVGDLGPDLEHEEGEGVNRKGLKRLDPPRPSEGDLNTQLLQLDRSDLSKGPVRPVGSAAALYMSSINGGVSFFDSKSSLRCRHIDEDPVHGFGGSAKPG